MPLTKDDKTHVAKKFLTWLNENRGNNVPESWVDRWAEAMMIACDQACAHGPGHQSISECVMTEPGHTYHADDYGNEWSDKDLSKQTHKRYKFAGRFPDRVRTDEYDEFRLYFGDY